METKANGTPALVSLSGGGTDTSSSQGTATGPGGTEVTSVTCTVTTAESLRDGAPQSVPAGTGWIDETGSDPVTGAAVDYHNDKYNPLNPPRIETGDWFSRLADFSAGAADALTGGLTRRVRQGLDLDGVNYNSPAYKVGTAVGTALDIALTPISPCGKARWLAQSIRGLSAVNATGQAVNAAEAIRNGDPLGALANSVGALFGFAKLGQACFTAGTPLLTPDGSRAIETLREGDLVLSRSEHDPDGPLRPRRVVQTFVRVAPILNLHVAGRVIETTREHPFYVSGKGWCTAHELRIGDLLVSHDGIRIAVEGVANSGRVETVYNVEIEEDHTYFVGSPDWGFDAWCHNPNYTRMGNAAEQAAKDWLTSKGWSIIGPIKRGSHGLDIVAQRTTRRGRLVTRVFEVKANGSRLSKLQKKGADAYAKDVLRRFGGSKNPNLSAETTKAAEVLEDMITNGEAIKGAVIKLDWAKLSGVLKTTVKRW